MLWIILLKVNVTKTFRQWQMFLQHCENMYLLFKKTDFQKMLRNICHINEVG